MQKVEAIVKCCYCGYLIEKKEISVNFQSTHTRNCPNNACKKANQNTNKRCNGSRKPC